MVFHVITYFSNEFLLSVFKDEKYKTDTTVFRLHYKLSVWLVILYSLCYMYVQLEAPINCMGDYHERWNSENNRKAVNDFCWVHGTYVLTSPSPYNSGSKDVYPGIHGITSKNDETFYLEYYKWMYFYSVSMLILLNVPRQIWRMIEGGRMRLLSSKLSLEFFINESREEVNKAEANLAEYLFAHVGCNTKYSVGFLLCEALNVVVSSIMLIVWDMIGNHLLSKYAWSGLSLIQTPWIQRTDPLAKVFPRLSKCTFNIYGASGNIQAFDFLCVLSLNVINEWAAVSFWCYFTVLFVIGFLELIYRVMLVCSKRMRASVLSGISPLTSQQEIDLIVKGCSYNDWFVMTQVGSCLEAAVFRQVLAKYIQQIRTKEDA